MKGSPELAGAKALFERERGMLLSRAPKHGSRAWWRLTAEERANFTAVRKQTWAALADSDRSAYLDEATTVLTAAGIP